MPHMMAQEHMGMVEALRYGTALNQATINAALFAIGSTQNWLVLTFSGTGVWNVTANTTINYLRIPMGVTVNVASGVTLAVGLLWADQANWKTGPGTYSASASATPVSISNLQTITYLQQNSIGGTLWTLTDAATPNPATIRMFVNQAATCGLTFSRADGVSNASWTMLVNNTGDLDIIRPGASAAIAVFNNNGLMLGSPSSAGSTWMLQLGSGDAAKPSGTTWNVTSDARTKNVLGTFDAGLAALLALPQPQRCTFNGKANTPVDGKEFVSLIAQDVQPVAPYMVNTYRAKLDPTDEYETDILSLDTSPMIFAVLNALREVDTRLKTLEGVAGAM